MKIDPQFCRVDDGLDTILGKWKIPIILYLLKNQTMRFSDLQKVLPEISKKMLSKNLKELEEDDLITRTVYPTVPPKVEYRLTEHGKELEDIIDSLHKWGLRHQQPLSKKLETHFSESQAFFILVVISLWMSCMPFPSSFDNLVNIIEFWFPS